MRKYIFLIFIFCSISAFAQVDKSELRRGNRKFKKDSYKEAEIDYRRALVKDSLSLAANYNLASSLYRQENYSGATDALKTVSGEGLSADYHYNAGDVALQLKDYATAVKEFREALLQTPNDLEAKENYIYAKKMLENQQDQQNQQDKNQDSDNQDSKDQDQNQQPQDQSQNQDSKDQEQQPQESQISKQQAQQLLNAVMAKEKETQDKVDKEKAEKLQSSQKEKNW